MKLIDILVGSGDGMSLFGLRTKYLAMDPDGRVYGYTEMPKPGIIGWSVPDNLYSTDGRGCLIQIDRDDVDGQWQSAIITREQYEAALAAKNEGWIDWPGGECPVPCGTMVDVKLRCGSVTRQRSGESLDWQHDGQYELGAIIAYRLHNPQDATTRANDYMLPQDFGPAADEADLNDCIGQDATPAWYGAGLPPVGCECEVSVDGGRSWCTYRAINEKNGARLIEIGNFTEEFQNNNWIFRPIRSKDDKKREAALDAIYGAIASAERANNRSDEADKVYEAIAAGKIPGVKLED